MPASILIPEQKWPTGILELPVSQEELEEFIQWKVEIYKKQKWTGSELSTIYLKDFDNIDSTVFKQAMPTTILGLRQFIRDNGAYDDELEQAFEVLVLKPKPKPKPKPAPPASAPPASNPLVTLASTPQLEIQPKSQAQGEPQTQTDQPSLMLPAAQPSLAQPAAQSSSPQPAAQSSTLPVVQSSTPPVSTLLAASALASNPALALALPTAQAEYMWLYWKGPDRISEQGIG